MRSVSARTAARFSLFLIYGWFGVLKVIGMSPAEGLVTDMFATVLAPAEAASLVALFGAFEVLIGIAFLLVGARRWVTRLFLLHMTTTFLPLVLLPSATWSGLLVPTLVGQYILKNFALLALVKGLAEGEE